ncbi:MAG: DMT family transporter [Henriciella sp.]|nr:DMT family transporter [Henriciella sp.]
MRNWFLSAPLLIAILAIAMGSGIDALVKGIAPNAGLHHLLAWRFLFGSLIALAIFRVQKRPMPTASAIRFHTMRGLIQLSCAFLFFYSLMHLPLAEATTIGFTAALMVPAVALVLLKEPITRVALVATLIGFAGAALAISATPPEAIETTQRPIALAACFLAAFLYALVLVMLRMRATQEDATTIAMFTNTVPAIALLPITFGALGPPNWSDLPLFAMFGGLGFTVWYLMTLAYARTSAQRLAPLEYTALIWSGLFGALFFSEVPGWQTWTGALIIIAACLLVAFEDRFATRKATHMPSSDLPD